MTAPTTAPTTAPAARAYLAAVAAELADLPDDERADLLEDLAAHLAALDEEGEAVPHSLRLGTPAAYAAELRAAAGLPPAGDPGRRRRTAELAERVAASGPVREVRAFLPLLAPAWWLARAYLVVALLAWLSGSGPRGTVLLDVGVPLAGWALLAVAAVLSVRLGRAHLPRPGAVVLRLAEVAVVLTVAAQVVSGLGHSTRVVYVDDGAPPAAGPRWPLLSESGPVTDVFPYAADGTPLDGVLLYDQDGRPLRVGAQEWWADGCERAPQWPRAADGVPVAHSYPQDYAVSDPSLPGCGELERPTVPLPVFPAPVAAEPAPVVPAG